MEPGCPGREEWLMAENKSGFDTASRTKGSVLVHFVKALRHYREESERVLPERLHRYLDQKILVSEWYPDDEFIELIAAMAKVLPAAARRDDLWEWIGAQGAEANLGRGVYAALVRPNDPIRTLQRYPAIWRMHHDSGEAKVRVISERRVELEVRHHLLRHEGFRRLQSGYSGKIAELAGAGAPTVSLRTEGSPVRVAIWDIAWS